mgnify:FL=1
MHISTYVYLFILPIDNYVRIIYNIDTVKIRNTKTKEILKMTVQEIAKELRGQDVWSMELLELLCDEADLTEEFENADGETFESVVYKAADVLNVEI